jgi:predicted RND superfamily exporter protein
MLTLYFSFKSLRGVFLPLITVLISTVWTLGLMSLMKIPLSIASNAIPVLLVAIGSAYGIHMLSKYNEEIHRGEDKIQGIKDALSEVGVPIFLAGITTLIGFLAFLSSSLSLIREFGVFTALGVMFAMIISVTFLPAVLSFLKVSEVKLNHGGIEDNWSTKSMERLGKFVLRNEKLFVGICIATVVIGFFAIPRLNREVNMVDYFQKDSEIRQAEEMMQSKLGGSIPMQILIEGDLKDPFVLKEIIKFEKYLEAQPHVNDPQSIADLICEMNRVMNGHATIPGTREGVANLWFFIEGQEILEQLINSEATEGLVQAKLGTVNTKKLNVLVKAVDKYIQEELKTDMVKFRISLASDELADELKKEKAERILSQLKLDIEKRGSEFAISGEELKTVIIASLTVGQEGFNPDSIKTIAAKINAYLHSEEADIQISSEKVMAGIVRDIGKKLPQTTPDEKDIINLLGKNIPERLYAEDPEALEYTATSIAAIINEENSWKKVNQLIEKLRPLFPQELADNKGFMKDLRDDVWEINEDWAVLTSSRYTEIFKNHDYPDENKSSLMAQQTGMPIIYMDIDKKIMRSQALSLSIAIFLVFVLLTFRLKSLVGGLISLSPIVLTILAAFTIMSIFSIPLDIVTVLIGSVAVGIGIDYTIHFLTRFKEEFSSCNSEIEALNTTLATTGKAIVINAVSVMLGFLVLVLGNIVPMQRFGYLIALTMVLSALASITVLPALILVTRAGFIGNFDRLSRKIASGLKDKVRQKVIEQREKLGKIRIKKGGV